MSMAMNWRACLHCTDIGKRKSKRGPQTTHSVFNPDDTMNFRSPKLPVRNAPSGIAICYCLKLKLVLQLAPGGADLAPLGPANGGRMIAPPPSPAICTTRVLYLLGTY